MLLEGLVLRDPPAPLFFYFLLWVFLPTYPSVGKQIIGESESASRSVVSDSLPPPGIIQARIQEWVAFPFSKGSSQPRDQTQVSRIAGRFFTIWATRELKGLRDNVVSNTLAGQMGKREKQGEEVRYAHLITGDWQPGRLPTALSFSAWQLSSFFIHLAYLF